LGGNDGQLFTCREDCAATGRGSLDRVQPDGLGHLRGTAVGAAFTFGSAGGALAPAIVGWIATSHSIAAALPLLALSFFLLVPMFFVRRAGNHAQGADRLRRAKDLTSLGRR
jgi:hypothetical protein